MACPICGAELVVGMQYCPACGANAADVVTGALKSGRVLAGRYRVVRLIARGGMGAVYLAVDMRLDEVDVAVKEMASLYRPGETDTFAQAVSEFRREAMLLARLSHPNLPRVFDRFEENGKHFLVMEFVQGHTLREVLNGYGGKAPPGEVYAWAAQLCTVLSYLHV